MEKIPENNSLGSMEGVPRQDTSLVFEDDYEGEVRLQEANKGVFPKEEREVEVGIGKIAEDEKALEVVRNNLGIGGVIHSSQHENKDLGQAEQKTQERIESAHIEDIRKATGQLSAEIQSLEDVLRSNGFYPIVFDAESINAIVANELDVGKVRVFLGDLLTNLRKDFMPRSEAQKLSIEPYQFQRLLDSLDELKSTFVGLRNLINKRPNIVNPQLKILSEDVKKIITVIALKMDSVEEIHSTLRNYRR
jgi:hypothetical protein